MITQLRGRLVEKSPTSVVIDCQGVGYLVNISLFTFGQLTDEENIQLFTHLQVREDAHTLYGFTTVGILPYPITFLVTDLISSRIRTFVKGP